VERDFWPMAAVQIVPDSTTRQADIATAIERAVSIRGNRMVNGGGKSMEIVRSQVVVVGNESRAGWASMARTSQRPRFDDIPVVVFG